MHRAQAWTVVLPVQRPSRAKSRLEVPPGVDREALARAIALDSLAAVREAAGVAHRVVVTSDVDLAEACRRAGDTVVRDDGRSLTAAVRSGVRAALEVTPAQPAAVLLADVPALTGEELQTALSEAAHHRSAVVPDAEGSGSVLLTAASAALLRPAFGADSARRHHELGADVLDLPLPRLRRDVDTWAALQEAAALGLGPATRAVVGAALGVAH